LAPKLFFLILAHPVYKMWIIDEPNTLELWNKLHFEDIKRRVYTMFKLLAPKLFFLILAHPVYKMWIIDEPNTLELWNKLNLKGKNGEYIAHLKYSLPIFVE